MSDPKLLSEHVKQFGSVGEEKLEMFAKMVERNFNLNSVVCQEKCMWINDYANSMTSLVLSLRDELKEAKKEKSRLTNSLWQVKEELDRTKQKLDEKPANVMFQTDSTEVEKLNLNKLLKKPRYFDGKNPLPYEWIEEYRDAIEDNKWNEATAVYYFKHFLTGDAATWYKISVRPKIQPGWRWSNLDEVFAANFLGRVEIDRTRLLLNNLIMKKEDRVSTFIPLVQKYLNVVEPGLSEKQIVSQVSSKLRPAYAQAIVEKDPQTIDELRDACRTVEAVMDLQDTFSKTSIRGREDVSGSTVKCYRCDRKGHIAKNCSASSKADGSRCNEPKRSQVGFVGAATDEDCSDDEVVVTCN